MRDLNEDQEQNVRLALRHLHWKCGQWAPLAKALRCTTGTLEKVASGRAVTPTMAFRVAAMLGTPIDDVLTGRAVSHACPNCGYAAETTEDAAVVHGPWAGE